MADLESTVHLLDPYWPDSDLFGNGPLLKKSPGQREGGKVSQPPAGGCQKPGAGLCASSAGLRQGAINPTRALPTRPAGKEPK